MERQGSDSYDAYKLIKNFISIFTNYCKSFDESHEKDFILLKNDVINFFFFYNIIF